MKLVEKKCPNCGAGLSFLEDDKGVVCEYCKKSYFIEKDEKKDLEDENNIDNFFKLTLTEIEKKQTLGVVIFIMVIIFITVIAFLIIFNSIFMSIRNDNFFDDSMNTVNKDDDIYNEESFVTDFKDLDEMTLEIIHDDTRDRLDRLQEYIWDDYNKDIWRYAGKYLLVKKDGNGNELYNVYYKSYLGEKTNVKVFAAVKYSNLKLSSEGLVLTSFNGQLFAPMLFINGGNSSYVHGYLSDEEFYNKVLRSKSGDYYIKADIGMYVEKR